MSLSGARTPARVIQVLLVLVVLFQLGLASAWIAVDRVPPYWDEAWYMFQGLYQYNSLRDGGLAAWHHTWINLERVRPSLVPTLLVPLYAAFGAGDDVGLIVNVVAFGLLLLATYGLGAAIHDSSTGLLATMVVGSYPIIIGLAHILLVEMVMVSLVALSLLALWRSDGFRHAGWSALAGLAIGLGFLSKVFFFIFVMGPCFVTVIGALRGADGRWRLPRPRQGGNLALCCALAAAIFAPWYVPNLQVLLQRSVGAAVGAEAGPYGPQDPLRWQNLVRYLVLFIGTASGILGFLLLILGSFGLGLGSARQDRSLRDRMRRRQALAFLLSSAVTGYAVFASLRNQDLKHVTGILPAMSCLTAWGIIRLARRRWPIAIAAAAVVMVVQATLSSFPGPLLNYRPSVQVLGRPLYLVYPANPPMHNCKNAAADPTPWPIREILDYCLAVADLENLPGHSAKVAIVPWHPVIEGTAFAFMAHRDELPVRLDATRPNDLNRQDVLVRATTEYGWRPHRANVDAVMAELAKPGSPFNLMPRRFPLPDGGEVTVYAKRPSPLLSDARTPMHAMDAVFSDWGRLVGIDVDCETDQDETTRVILAYYWEALAPAKANYKVFIHLLDPETDEIVAQDDHPLFPQVYPTSMWQAGRYLFEERSVMVPRAYGGNSLRLRLGVYDESGRVEVISPATASATFVDAALVNLEKAPVR